jgi:hypothetical protein
MDGACDVADFFAVFEQFVAARGQGFQFVGQTQAAQVVGSLCVSVARWVVAKSSGIGIVPA